MDFFLLIDLNYVVIMFQKNITMHEIKLLRILNVSKTTRLSRNTRVVILIFLDRLKYSNVRINRRLNEQ